MFVHCILTLADPRLGLCSCCRGRIEQVGTPREILERPATPFVMNFIADVNQLPSTSQVSPPLFLLTRGHMCCDSPCLQQPRPPEFLKQHAHQLVEVLNQQEVRVMPLLVPLFAEWFCLSVLGLGRIHACNTLHILAGAW